MRALIFDLQPESLSTDGLIAALERQVAVLKTRHQLMVETDFCSEPAIPLAVKETVYRIFLEASHNMIKHARATKVIFSLSLKDGVICFGVMDNGVGFDPFHPYPGHLKIHSMHE